jgi:large subunit ribosomal protein L13
MLNDKLTEIEGTYRRVRSYEPGAEVGESWVIVDATSQILGRLATEVATVLRGKHRPEFAPNRDAGDHVIIINAEKITVSGNKPEQKMYHRHSGYIGGLTSRTFREMMERDPTEVVRRAVVGMLPHTRLGRRLAKRLRIYVGADHPHEAQQPEQMVLRG